MTIKRKLQLEHEMKWKESERVTYRDRTMRASEEVEIVRERDRERECEREIERERARE